MKKHGITVKPIVGQPPGPGEVAGAMAGEGLFQFRKAHAASVAVRHRLAVCGNGAIRHGD